MFVLGRIKRYFQGRRGRRFILIPQHHILIKSFFGMGAKRGYTAMVFFILYPWREIVQDFMQGVLELMDGSWQRMKR